MWLANIRRSFTALQLHDRASPLGHGALAAFDTVFTGLASACQRAIEALEAVTGMNIPWEPLEIDVPEPEAAAVPDAPEVPAK